MAVSVSNFNSTERAYHLFKLAPPLQDCTFLRLPLVAFSIRALDPPPLISKFTITLISPYRSFTEHLSRALPTDLFFPYSDQFVQNLNVNALYVVNILLHRTDPSPRDYFVSGFRSVLVNATNKTLRQNLIYLETWFRATERLSTIALLPG